MQFLEPPSPPPPPAPTIIVQPAPAQPIVVQPSPTQPVVVQLPPTPPKPWHEVWLPPFIPVIPALLALWGVYYGLGWNTRRVRTEQLERRAHEQQVELQKVYGDFGGAALECFMVNQTKVGIQADQGKIDRGELDGNLSEAELKRGVDAIPERWKAAQDRGRDAYAKMAAAVARLLVLDDDKTRQKELDSLFRRVGNIRHWDPEDKLIELREALKSHLSDMGTELEGRYRSMALAAERGYYSTPPVILLRADPEEVQDNGPSV